MGLHAVKPDSKATYARRRIRNLVQQWAISLNPELEHLDNSFQKCLIARYAEWAFYTTKIPQAEKRKALDRLAEWQGLLESEATEGDWLELMKKLVVPQGPEETSSSVTGGEPEDTTSDVSDNMAEAFALLPDELLPRA